VRLKGLSVAVVALALVASGCGARLDEKQRVAAEAGAGSRTASGAPTAGSPSAGDAATADTTPGATPGATTPGAASGATATTVAGGGGAAAACSGGATDVGVTGNSIQVGNVSTLTGPVPGLFEGAVVGTQAFIAYLNSQGGICGRQLKLKVGDDRFDQGEHRNQVIGQIPQVFSFLGSFSIYDDGGAAEMGQAKVPDVGYALANVRGKLAVNFSPQPLPPGWRLGPLNYYKQKFPDVITHVGALVGDVPSAIQAYNGEAAAMQSLGYKITYSRRYQPTETDFTSDVIKMQSGGVQMVIMTGDVTGMARLAKAMAQQGFKPKLNNMAANAYDHRYVEIAGAAAENTLLDQQLPLFAGEDGGTVPEVALFNQWIQKVRPGFKPDIFAAYGWASGRLFEQAARAVGGALTRASLLAALGKIDNFDSNGLVAPAGPASKRPPTCYILILVKGGKFQRTDEPPTGYRCNDGGFFSAG
jgi:ABC-type branched-subunit amino acid transport system substrate-binding protein